MNLYISILKYMYREITTFAVDDIVEPSLNWRQHNYYSNNKFDNVNFCEQKNNVIKYLPSNTYPHHRSDHLSVIFLKNIPRAKSWLRAIVTIKIHHPNTQ